MRGCEQLTKLPSFLRAVINVDSTAESLLTRYSTENLALIPENVKVGVLTRSIRTIGTSSIPFTNQIFDQSQSRLIVC